MENVKEIQPEVFLIEDPDGSLNACGIDTLPVRELPPEKGLVRCHRCNLLLEFVQPAPLVQCRVCQTLNCPIPGQEMGGLVLQIQCPVCRTVNITHYGSSLFRCGQCCTSINISSLYSRRRRASDSSGGVYRYNRHTPPRGGVQQAPRGGNQQAPPPGGGVHAIVSSSNRRPSSQNIPSGRILQPLPPPQSQPPPPPQGQPPTPSQPQGQPPPPSIPSPQGEATQNRVNPQGVGSESVSQPRQRIAKKLKSIKKYILRR
eukprot:GHVL01019555.1.p1 GENE.GHVL01019555.1~~GHVL01019555.1.p1  ORF type:complete len:259 (+),score=76.48 GHVL01019555.1:85-861(+)